MHLQLRRLEAEVSYLPYGPHRDTDTHTLISQIFPNHRCYLTISWEAQSYCCSYHRVQLSRLRCRCWTVDDFGGVFFLLFPSPAPVGWLLLLFFVVYPRKIDFRKARRDNGQHGKRTRDGTAKKRKTRDKNWENQCSHQNSHRFAIRASLADVGFFSFFTSFQSTRPTKHFNVCYGNSYNDIARGFFSVKAFYGELPVTVTRRVSSNFPNNNHPDDNNRRISLCVWFV